MSGKWQNVAHIKCRRKKKTKNKHNSEKKKKKVHSKRRLSAYSHFQFNIDEQREMWISALVFVKLKKKQNNKKNLYSINCSLPLGPDSDFPEVP